MSIYKGTTLLSGVATNTITNAHDLFDWKWTDHELNDQSWLKADTFSWQDGTVYSDAYSHLVADYSGGATQKTETIGSHTITFVEATDGHRITTDESTVADIYTESGVAWFYVLDTANQRFKLPRSTHGQIVEKYQNGTEWYRVYSDGWCEQGGAVDFSGYSGRTGPTITFLVPFIDTNYNIEAVAISPSSDGSVNVYATKSSATQCVIVKNWTSANYGGNWRACGYASKPTQNAQYKYLYFYVGEYSQSATEQTAGINASLFNGKLDLDLNNITQTGIDHIISLIPAKIPNWFSGTDQSLNTVYQAETDGYVQVTGSSGGSIYGSTNLNIQLSSDGTTFESVVADGCYSTGGASKLIVPVKAGTYYKGTGGSGSLKFFAMG